MIGAIVLLSGLATSAPLTVAATPAQAPGATFSEDPQIALLAKQAEAELTTDTDLPKLVATAMDSRNSLVRANALVAIAVVFSRLQNAPDSDSRADTRIAELSRSLRPVAVAALKDGDGPIRRHAFVALSAIESATGAPPTELEGIAQGLLLRDPEPVARLTALNYLSSQSKTRTTAASWLRIAARDPSPVVRQGAFQLVALERNADGIPFLLEGLRDGSDPFSRIAAAGALRTFVTLDPSIVDSVSQQLQVEGDAYAKEQLGLILESMRALLK